MGVKRLTEKAFMETVVQYARLRGWIVYHTHDSRHCEKGFPDLVFSRGPGHAIRLVVAELKLAGNKPTVEQYAWLSAFESIAPTYCWTPDDWPEIERVLGDDS